MGSDTMAATMRTLFLLFLAIKTADMGPQLDFGKIIQVLFDTNRQDSENEQQKRILTDYQDCGELGKAYYSPLLIDDSCLRNCDWKPNPSYKYSFPWDLFFNQSDCKEVQNFQIRVLITAPKVPKDLSCLEPCIAGTLDARCPKARRSTHCVNDAFFPKSLSRGIGCLISVLRNTKPVLPE